VDISWILDIHVWEEVNVPRGSFQGRCKPRSRKSQWRIPQQIGLPTTHTSTRQKEAADSASPVSSTRKYWNPLPSDWIFNFSICFECSPPILNSSATANTPADSKIDFLPSPQSTKIIDHSPFARAKSGEYAGSRKNDPAPQTPA